MANLKDYATALLTNSPGTSGTSFSVESGKGSRFPTVPFYATVHPEGQMPTLDNAEKVKVTARSTDTLTVVRARGDTTVKDVQSGWRISNTIFAEDIVGSTRPTIANAYTTVSGTPVMFIAHRGGANINPENTIQAWDNALAAGCKVIEMDVYKLADSSLGIMHDSTLTRTTTSTANTADQTAMSFPALTVDIGATLGGAYTSKTYPAPMFEEVLRRYGNKAVIMPEAKNAGSGALITAALQKFNIDPETVIVQSVDTDELTSVVAAGYHALALGDSLTPATLVSAGIEYVGCSTSATSTYIGDCVSAGLKVFAYTVDRQYIRNTFMGYGVTGFFSNDPIYLSGTGYRLTTDPFASQTWYHGHLPDPTSNDRGTFVSPDRLQIANADRQYILQGWASPVGGTEGNTGFTVTFSIRFTSLTATRWGGIAIFNKDWGFDDGQSNTSTGLNGYHFLFRTEGTLQCYKVTNGVATQLGGDVATAALAANNTYNMTLTVTPTGLSWARSGYTALTNSDTSYRGGYIYFSHRVNPAQFFDVTVTDT